ncbi:pyridoxal-phosphate dependent enzyme [Micromonospora chersina]|uniref:pyridoxal-phosphate dependent enzyme n=1 Tax=Micromonospora chersina TaxID=47854 RepID=UPI0037185184
MPVVSAPYEFRNADVYLDLEPTTGRRPAVKGDGLNFGGSVKMRAAAAMVARAARESLITHDTRLVESSSGNLGVALAVIAANKGIPFTCVVDPRCNAATLAMNGELRQSGRLQSCPYDERLSDRTARPADARAVQIVHMALPIRPVAVGDGQARRA